MRVLQIVAAVASACMVAVWYIRHRSLVIQRLNGLTAVFCVKEDEPWQGVDVLLSSIIAVLRTGASVHSTPLQACCDSSNRVDGNRVSMWLCEVSQGKESSESLCQVGHAIASGCALSAHLGCSLADCLDGVLDAYKRQCLQDDLRDNAYAMPQASVRLLSALPGITIVISECLGAQPIAFLCFQRAGNVCLILGACCYALGMVWIHTLLAHMSDGNV